jgi:cysteine dioxygenase
MRCSAERRTFHPAGTWVHAAKAGRERGTSVRLDEFVSAARSHGPQGMSRDDLLALTRQLELPDDLIDGHLAFDPDSYARNLILRTPGFELLALCWLPGQRSTIHDHGGSVGVVRVYRGDLTSRLYDAQDGEPARMISEDDVGPGTHAAVDRPDIHQLANETGEDLVTIHIYSPPLAALGVYRTDSPERERLHLRYTLHEDLG